MSQLPLLFAGTGINWETVVLSNSSPRQRINTAGGTHKNTEGNYKWRARVCCPKGRTIKIKVTVKQNLIRLLFAINYNVNKYIHLFFLTNRVKIMVFNLLSLTIDTAKDSMKIKALHYSIEVQIRSQ